jgi:disulfide bond formation protein DsbB
MTFAIPGEPMTTTPGARPTGSFFTLTALLVALTASAGSLWLTLGTDMKLKACPLCLYQRAGVFAAAAVLLIGFLARDRDVSLIALLALAPAAMATGVGVFHNYLMYEGKLECPPGIASVGTAPLQALAIEAILLLLLLPAAARRLGTALLAIALGAALAALLIKSAPPMPPLPLKPYEGTFDTCRPPFPAPKPAEGK